jgi:hypothetical protein
MWKSIFSVGLWLIATQVFAQEKPAAETKGKFMPSYIRVNYNVLRGGENLLDRPQASQEISAELGLHKYQLVTDFGQAIVTRGGEDYSYVSDGNYFRVGVDMNLVKNRETLNVIALGARYARARFGDEAIFTTDKFDGFEQDFLYRNPDVQARWIELTLTLKTKVWNQFFMGYTMRYQIFRQVTGAEDLQPFDIPGYGSTTKNNSFGFDFYLGYRIPF